MDSDIAVSAEIFRAYDIRGVVDKTLTPDVVRALGRAIASEALDAGQRTIYVGRDGRLSGASLSEALIEGLCASGVDVIDIGQVPTPVLYFATATGLSESGVMLTGSHNPPGYNGLKIVIAGQTLTEDRIQRLKSRILNRDYALGQGRCDQQEMIQAYLDYVLKDVQLKRPLKVVIDCGNGIAGAVAPQLFRGLGCEVTELFCDVDGHFPNHHPDPSVPENLKTLIETVKKESADIGLAFDGDGDRCGVISEQGDIIWPDRQLMLFAKDLLIRIPKEKILFDVKCTRHLPTVIQQQGGEPVMWKTGHSLLKKKMKEENILLAGEMSGHIFFKERWFGFDDGLYTGARLLELLSHMTQTLGECFAAFPESLSTPELKVPVAEEKKFALMSELVKRAAFEGATLTTIDGIRADFPEGWGLVRPSNTTPYLILRFEAQDAEALSRIQTQFKSLLLSVDQALEIPF